MHSKFSKLLGIGLGCLIGLGFYVWSPTLGVLAQEPDEEILSDPVTLGAWLYEGNCVRCHGPYERERVGARYDDAALEAAIGSDGCQIKWGRQYDGPLKSKEVEALAAFILAWEAAGQAPELPELPAQPTPTPSPSPTPPDEAASPTPTATPDPLTDEVRNLIETDEVAKGAWLYTQHCYRCHQSYASYRQGLGLSADEIRTFIEEGKTATQMLPFSRQKGGPLFGSEVEAIVTYIVTWEELGTDPDLPPVLLAGPTPDPAFLEAVFPPDPTSVSAPATTTVVEQPAASNRSPEPRPVGLLMLLVSAMIVMIIVLQRN